MNERARDKKKERPTNEKILPKMANIFIVRSSKPKNTVEIIKIK
jgi:hypothetical protein